MRNRAARSRFGSADLTTSSVLHITDLHLRANAGERLLGVDTAHSLHAVLEQALGGAVPDALLVTGDVAHDPEPASYARFVDIIAAHYTGPLLCLPGNHDLTAPMRGVLGERVLHLPRWDIVGIDSHVDDRTGGALGAGEFELLEEAVGRAADRHVLIATHHPPVLVDCPWLDEDRIQNSAELLEWLSEHASVKGLVFGHAHQVVESAHEHVALLGTPSTCFQFAPRSERFAIDDTMPGYRWLHLSADGTISSEVGRVLDYPLQIDLSTRS